MAIQQYFEGDERRTEKLELNRNIVVLMVATGGNLKMRFVIECEWCHAVVHPSLIYELFCFAFCSFHVISRFVRTNTVLQFAKWENYLEITKTENNTKGSLSVENYTHIYIMIWPNLVFFSHNFDGTWIFAHSFIQLDWVSSYSVQYSLFTSLD